MNEDPWSIIRAMENKGWTRRFVAREPRLSEAVDMYREVGFEVHLKPLPKEPECESCTGEEGENECRLCYEGFEGQYKIILTRPISAVSQQDDDLF